MTPFRIIHRALRLIGVADAEREPEGQEVEDAIEAFNGMLGHWAEQRWLVYARTEVSFSLSVGTTQYAMGSGQAVNAEPFIVLEHGYIRDSGGLDHVLEVLQHRRHLINVVDKDNSVRPGKVYYQRGSSEVNGQIEFNSAPSAVETCHLFGTQYFSKVAEANLHAEMEFRQGYDQTMAFNLAILLAPEFERTPAKMVTDIAEQSLSRVKDNNMEVPELVFDDALQHNVMHNRGTGSIETE